MEENNKRLADAVIDLGLTPQEEGFIRLQYDNLKENYAEVRLFWDTDDMYVEFEVSDGVVRLYPGIRFTSHKIGEPN